MHWVAIYVSESGDGWYFDSFGMPPHIPDHVNRIQRNCKRIRWNNVRLQSSYSNACGKYCIMFLYYMMTGLGMQRFLENFSSNLNKNDEIAEKFTGKL